MPDITAVSFVPKSKRDRLRDVLTTENTGALRWTERKGFARSEFHFSGPASLVMKTHAYVSRWLVEPPRS